MKKKFKLEVTSTKRLIQQSLLGLLFLIGLGQYFLVLSPILFLGAVSLLYFYHKALLPRNIKTIQIKKEGFEVLEDQQFYRWQDLRWYRFDEIGTLSRNISFGLKGRFFPLKFECLYKSKYAGNWYAFKKGVIHTGRKHNVNLHNFFHHKIWTILLVLFAMLLLYWCVDLGFNGNKNRIGYLLFGIMGWLKLFHLIAINKR
ncbi:MAG: hypothetical protein AAGD05_18940 [Bacteroidota bacterium]